MPGVAWKADFSGNALQYARDLRTTLKGIDAAQRANLKAAKDVAAVELSQARAKATLAKTELAQQAEKRKAFEATQKAAVNAHRVQVAASADETKRRVAVLQHVASLSRDQVGVEKELIKQATSRADAEARGNRLVGWKQRSETVGAAKRYAAEQNRAAAEALRNQQHNVRLWSESWGGIVPRFRAALSGIGASWKQMTTATTVEGRMAGKAGLVESLEAAAVSGGQLLSVAGALASPLIAVGSALFTIGKWGLYAGAGIAAVVTAASVAFAKLVIEASAARQATIMAMNAMTGGKGEASYARIKKEAVELGLTFQQTSDSVRTMMAYGFAGEDAFSWMRRLQDLSAIGFDQERLGRLSVTIGQIRANGKLMGDELRELRDVINVEWIYEGIAKAMGKTVDEVKKMQQSKPGSLLAKDVEAGIAFAISKMTGAEKAGDARVKFMQTTVAGAWQGLKGAASMALMDIAERGVATFESIKPTLDSITAWFRSPDASAWVDRLTKYFGFVIRTGQDMFGALTAFLKGFAPELGKAFDTLAGGKNPLEMLKDPAVLASIQQIGKDFGAFIVQVGSAAKQINDVVTLLGRFNIIDTMLTSIRFSWNATMGVLKTVPVLGPLISAIEFIGTTIKGVIAQVNLLIGWLNKIPGVNISAPTVSGGAGGSVAGADTSGGINDTRGKALHDQYESINKGYASGGTVEETGIAKVHRGEEIVNAGNALAMRGGGGNVSASFSPTIVQQPGESSSDLVERLWLKWLEYTEGRGISMAGAEV